MRCIFSISLAVWLAAAGASAQEKVSKYDAMPQALVPAGDFTTSVWRARSDFGFSPRMFASALVQYSSNDRVFSSNLRFRWEYRPGSELFVVYTDERDTTVVGFPGLRNRAFVVKVNRLLRF